MVENAGICVIVGAGDFDGFTQEYDRKNIYLIAADGGYNYLNAMKLVPDVWIGDADSLEAEISLPDECRRIDLPVEKDDTDMLAAVKIGLEKGCRQFHLYGGTGGRFDHTLANIKVMAYISEHGGTVYMFDNEGVLTVLENSSILFGASERGYISVFSMVDVSEGVSIHGLKYELENASLTGTSSIGVSNAFIPNRKSSISVRNGRLLISLERCFCEFPQRV